MAAQIIKALSNAAAVWLPTTFAQTLPGCWLSLHVAKVFSPHHYPHPHHPLVNNVLLPPPFVCCTHTQEMASRFVPRPLERLLAVVTALLHRCEAGEE